MNFRSRNESVSGDLESGGTHAKTSVDSEAPQSDGCEIPSGGATGVERTESVDTEQKKALDTIAALDPLTKTDKDAQE